VKAAALGLLTGEGVWLPLAVFIATGALVFLIASRLARHADAIADATGLGRVWIGAVLLAASTSLPELTTDVSAAALHTPDIGVGDLMGSTMANMLILALLDLVFARRRILQQVALDHTLVCTLAIVMTGMAGVAIAAGGIGRIGPVGLDTALIAGVYLFGMHAVYRAARVKTMPAQQLELGESSGTLLRSGVIGMVLAAVGLLVLAPVVVVAAEAVAIEAGLTTTFVGTLLVGITTSFPEMAASVAAVHMGALDLAVGNIFGSNAFNMCILFAMDLAYRDGPLLAGVSRDHVLGAQLAVLCLSLGMMGILARAERRIAVVRIESLLIVGAYAGGAWLLAHLHG
jgi:cation:H+ antiporter